MIGALIIDKPAGITSHDVVIRARRILHERRIGHTGTLDPFATGVLVLLLGKATRLAQFFSGLDKEYEALIRIGFATDTGDRTGMPLNAAQVKEPPTRAAIEAALASLRGEIEQIPPMYSAKKVKGKKLYEMARRGETIERQPIRVRVDVFELMESNQPLKNNLDGTFDFKARVVCSSGTYVRMLAEEFGERLGTGAHLAELKRTRIGDFKIWDAITLEQLELEGSLTRIITPYDALSGLDSYQLSEDELDKIKNGVAIRVERQWLHDQSVRLCDDAQHLVAVARFDVNDALLHPRVVLSETDKDE